MKKESGNSVSKQSSVAPLTIDMGQKELTTEDLELLKKIQDGMKNRKNVSGSSIQ